MRINPDNKKIRYSGRIDWAESKRTNLGLSMYICGI